MFHSFAFSNIKIPEVGKIYSFNEGNNDLWDEDVQKYISSLKNPGRISGPLGIG